MSHQSNDNPPSNRPRQDAAVNDLQISNQTSGHFLGTVPRGWMLQKENAHAPAVSTNVASHKRRYTHAGGSTESATVRDVARNDLPEPQGILSIEATRSQLDRPATLRVQSDGNLDTLPTDVLNTNRRAFDNNIRTSQSTERQSTAIPTPNASPRDLASAFAHNTAALTSVSHPIQAVWPNSTRQPGTLGHLEYGFPNARIPHPHRTASASSARSPTHSSSFRPPPSSNDVLQLSTPIMSPTTVMTNTPAVPAKRPYGYPSDLSYSGSGPIQRPRSLPQQVPGLNNPRTASNQLVNVTASPSQAPIVNTARPDLLRGLNKAKDKFHHANLLSQHDDVRFGWLTGACQHGDTFFMLLHQLVCIWTNCPPFLSSPMGFLPGQTHGLQVLTSILADTRQLHPEVLAFFCNFIIPLPSFASNCSPAFVQWINTAKVFLGTFAGQWKVLRDQVDTRRCPPSARDLAEILGLRSYVLSQAIFMRFLYQMFPGFTHSFAFAAFEFFRKSQEVLAHRERSRIVGTPRDLDADDERNVFETRLRELVRTQYQPACNVSAPSTSTTGFNAVQTYRVPQSPATTSSGGSNQSAVTSSSHNSLNVSSSQFPHMAVGRLVPSTGQLLHIVVDPTPKRNALHQVHLFDPLLKFDHLDTGAESKRRMYLFLKCLIGDPEMIDTTTVFRTWSVSVPPDIFEQRVRETPSQKDGSFTRTTRLAHNSSIVFYIRCVQHRADVETVSESEHNAEATYWPQNIFLSMNGSHLDFRRKIQHGRDLPIDVSHIIRQDSNELKLSYHANQSEAKRQYRFAIRLEAVVVLDHNTVTQLPALVAAEDSKNAIMSRIQRANIDDDVVLADTHISIDLIDPFTARMFEQPVRGSSCIHRECFDLEPFLQSRNCRNKDDVVHADEWKCPICGKDARPSTLIIDGFLLKVRQKLIADGKVDTKAILMKDDGTWEPKVEIPARSNNGFNKDATELQPTKPSEQVTDAGNNESGLSAAALYEEATATEPLVIILDDDDVG